MADSTNEAAAVELLPCPFCKDGGTPSVYAPNPHVWCLTCDCAGPHLDTPEEAVAAWNTRAAIAAHAAALAGEAVTTEQLIGILSQYRCTEQVEEDDGGGLPLVDALTPKWATSIAEGKREIEGLADWIAGELTHPTSAPSVNEGQAKPTLDVAALRDAELWRMCNGVHKIDDNEEVRCHVIVGCNVWKDGQWSGFYQGTPEEVQKALTAALAQQETAHEQR